MTHKTFADVDHNTSHTDHLSIVLFFFTDYLTPGISTICKCLHILTCLPLIQVDPHALLYTRLCLSQTVLPLFLFHHYTILSVEHFFRHSSLVPAFSP